MDSHIDIYRDIPTQTTDTHTHTHIDILRDIPTQTTDTHTHTHIDTHAESTARHSEAVPVQLTDRRRRRRGAASEAGMRLSVR